MADARLAEITLPDFGMSDAMPEIPADDLSRTAWSACGRARTSRATTTWSSTPIANTAPTSRTSPASTRASRRRCSSSARPASRPSWSATSATAWPERLRSGCGVTCSRTSACPASRAIAPGARARLLAAEGIRDDSRVGVIGWKEYADRGDDRGPGVHRRRAPADDPVGRRSRTPDHLLIDAADGLRVINEVEQLAAFEYASCRTSHGVRQLLVRIAARDARVRRRRARSSGTGCRSRAT